MKIAYVTASFPYGSGETFLDAEVSAVAKLVEKIIIIPTRPTGRIRKQWENGNFQPRVLYEPMLSAKMLASFLCYIFLHPLIFFRIFKLLIQNSKSTKKLLKNILVFPKGVWLASRAKVEGIDHIHVHWGSTSSTMVLICAIISGVSWSLTCHRWDIYENNLLKIKSDFARFVRFISHRGASDAEKLGVKRSSSTVIPMGVQINSPPPVRSLDRVVPHILCAANLIEVKGHKYLLEAIRMLRDDQIHVKLFLAGAGPLESELRRITTENKLERHIEFLGQMDHEDLMNSYESNEVDIFVLPSIEMPGGNHEGIPVSLMEAMAHGVPCISTKTGSIEELIPAAEGLTVLHADAEALAKKIKTLVTNSIEYRRASTSLGKILFSGWSAAVSAEKIVGEIEARNRLKGR